MILLLEIVLPIIAVILLMFATSARIVTQIERGVVFRLGRLYGPTRRPGLTVLVPFIDRMRKINIQIITMPIPAQEGITRDNVTVRVDAVVYFKVTDPIAAAIKVEDYRFAVSQVAQTSLRSIIGKSDLDDLLSNREPINQGLELMLDSPAEGWGIEIDRVEIKDVALPESMKRSMSRQAEAERERRARIITADGEFQASKKLSSAADQMAKSPSALQLRLLQTMVEVAAEKNSTLVLPFPVELLRFLESATGQHLDMLGRVEEPSHSADDSADASQSADTDDTDDAAGLAPVNDGTAAAQVSEPPGPLDPAEPSVAHPDIPEPPTPPEPRIPEADIPEAPDPDDPATQETAPRAGDDRS